MPCFLEGIFQNYPTLRQAGSKGEKWTVLTDILYCKLGNFGEGLFLQNLADLKFRENKPLRNGEITLSFTYVGNSCTSCEFLVSQVHVCLLMLFSKIKFLRKFPNLRHSRALSATCSTTV